MSHRKDRVRAMQDKKETPNWNPPNPPWNPEPEPLSIRATPDPELEPEPVDMGLEDKVEEMVESEELDIEEIVEDLPEDGAGAQSAIDPPGLMQYTVECQTGITINGKVFEAGVHLVDEGIYETLSNLDAPYK